MELALVDFTSVADVTALVPSFRFEGDTQILVARYDGLPFPAVAFHTQRRMGNLEYVIRRLRMRTRRPVVAELPWYLVDEGRRSVVESASSITESQQEWQMYLLKCRLAVSS